VSDDPWSGEQWQAFIFDPQAQRLALLDNITAKMYPDNVTLAEELTKIALDELSHNNWAKLCQFKGESSPQTYLISVFRSAIIDYQRKLFGRCRPPSWIEKLGAPWVLLHKQLCCAKQAMQSAIDLCQQKYTLSNDWIQASIREIRLRIPDCGGISRAVNQPSQRIDDEQVFSQVADSPSNDSHTEHLLHALAGLLTDQDNPAWQQLQQNLRLPAEWMILLRLRYVDEMSEQKIANALNKTRDQVRGQLAKALKALQQGLSRAGLSAADVRQWQQQVLDTKHPNKAAGDHRPKST